MGIHEKEDKVIIIDDSEKGININDSEDSLFITEDRGDVFVEVQYPNNPVVSDSPENVNVEEVSDVIHEITDALSIYQNTTIVNNYTVEDESEMPLDREIDFVGDDVIYKGYAEPNSATSDPVWKIQRITFFGIDEDIQVRFAGTGEFDQVWDNREALVY